MGYTYFFIKLIVSILNENTSIQVIPVFRQHYRKHIFLQNDSLDRKRPANLNSKIR